MLIIIFLFPHRGPGAGLAQLVTAQLLEGPEASLVSGAKVRNIRMSKWLVNQCPYSHAAQESSVQNGPRISY